jgi:hypothetical protein
VLKIKIVTILPLQRLEPIRLYLIKYLFQTGTNSAIPNEIYFSNGNRFGQMGNNSVTPILFVVSIKTVRQEIAAIPLDMLA